MFYPNPNNQDNDRDSDPSHSIKISDSDSKSNSNSDDEPESKVEDDIKSDITSTSTKEEDFGIWGRRNSSNSITIPESGSVSVPAEENEEDYEDLQFAIPRRTESKTTTKTSTKSGVSSSERSTSRNSSESDGKKSERNTSRKSSESDGKKSVNVEKSVNGETSVQLEDEASGEETKDEKSEVGELFDVEKEGITCPIYDVSTPLLVSLQGNKSISPAYPTIVYSQQSKSNNSDLLIDSVSDSSNSLSRRLSLNNSEPINLSSLTGRYFGRTILRFGINPGILNLWKKITRYYCKTA